MNSRIVRVVQAEENSAGGAVIRALVVILMSLLVLVGLFLVLRPEQPAGQPRALSFDLRIRDGAMNPDQITLDEDDRVTLRVTADRPTEFHLHGYDVKREVEPGEMAEVSFEADITGRFEIEDEGRSEELGVLTVRPR